MKRRVVITGTGLVIPQGVTTATAWSNICGGVSGISRISRFDISDYPVQIAGEIKDFNPDDHFEKKNAKHLDPFTQYAIVAARMALAESGLTIDPRNAERVGVITGCGIGSLPTIANQHEVALNKGFRRISPFFITSAIPNMPSGHISMDTGAKGPNMTITTACAAGTHAVGDAYRTIQYGTSDAIFAGGTEAVICPLGLNGFAAMKALSTRNDAPTAASRPFDKDRDGFVMAEGAGIVLLEELEHARRRGAKIIAEIVGYGLSSDAYHIAAPPEDGEGAARAMRYAIDDAGFGVDTIDYINAHGTSTPLNDRCETIAIKSVFGEHAYKLAVSSTKSMTGHLLGGAGGIEAVFTALAIRDQIAPPTINLQEASPECDLDYVPNIARKMAIRAAMSNSFGFGGTNAVVVMQRYEA
jgi:3-oxoacyl-[acyl-carrier-protein] synthase II